jgi:hypothetical protein
MAILLIFSSFSTYSIGGHIPYEQQQVEIIVQGAYNMTNEQLKQVACEIIDMNGGDLVYELKYWFTENGNTCLSCRIRHIESGFNAIVSSADDWERLIRDVHDESEKMLMEVMR